MRQQDPFDFFCFLYSHLDHPAFFYLAGTSISGNILKIMIHSSCEIEFCVETHLCKLCVIFRSRVLRVVCPHEGYRSAT